MTPTPPPSTEPSPLPGLPITRRRLFAGVAAIGAVAIVNACGGDDSGASSPTPSGGATAAPDTSAGTTGTRTVIDEFGKVTVPAEPQRVVFMDVTTLGNALALGLPVERIAAAGFANNDRAPWSYLEPYASLSSIADSGDINEPNAEHVATFDADLIVMLSMFDEQRDQLAKLGTPLYTALNGYNSIDEMMELLRDVGDALGLSAKAAELEADFRARADSIVAKFDGRLPSATSIRVFEESEIWTQVPPILELMKVPRQTPPPPELFEQLSPERLSDADGDLLWVSGSAGPDASRAVLEGNPLWASMDVVQAGMVRYVPDQPWGTDYSYPALVMILDEVEAGLDAWLATQ
jgi:iron complex transport system substrate-binding protein